MPHIIANTMNMIELLMPALTAVAPSTPIIRLAAADSTRPVAINLLHRAVGQESVDEGAHGIGPEKAGANDTKLRGVEQAASISGCFITPIDIRHT